MYFVVILTGATCCFDLWEGGNGDANGLASAFLEMVEVGQAEAIGRERRWAHNGLLGSWEMAPATTGASL